MELGKVIRTKREELKMTQEMLAERLSVTPQAVSRWENDISYPDLQMIVKLAGIFCISTDVLLGNVAMSQKNVDAMTGGEKQLMMQMPDGSLTPAQAPAMSQDQANAYFPEEPETDGERRKGKKIILLDDARFMRQIMQDIMDKKGHELHTCACGKELFELLETMEPDLILLDIMLDGESGLEILKELKEKRPELKVLMLSALSTEYAVKTAKERGAEGFIVKPFNVETLLEKVER